MRALRAPRRLRRIFAENRRRGVSLITFRDMSFPIYELKSVVIHTRLIASAAYQHLLWLLEGSSDLPQTRTSTLALLPSLLQDMLFSFHSRIW